MEVVVGDVVPADEGVEVGAEVAGEDGRSLIGTAEDGAPADGLLAVGGVSVVGCGPAVADGEEQAARGRGDGERGHDGDGNDDGAPPAVRGGGHGAHPGQAGYRLRPHAVSDRYRPPRPSLTALVTDNDNAEVNVEVLGPVRIDGAAVSPRERALLAALAIRRGQVVSAEELAHAVWVERPPTSWRKQIHITVGLLRRTLGADRIETVGSGYALRLADDEFDAARFESLLDTARRHTVLGEAERAVASFDGALALWRGTPYADLPDWLPGVDEAGRLGEMRDAAEEELVASRLECGLHRSVVPDAQRLVRANPTRERRWSMLATALYRCGRQADALAALREARHRLLDEFGLSPDVSWPTWRRSPAPGPRLGSDRRTPTGARRLPVPRPRRVRRHRSDDFFGRETEVAQVLDRLAARRFIVLTGPSGCGKSSLMRAGAIPALRARGLHVIVLTPSAGGIDAVPGAARAAHAVVAVDQFEELFHLGLDRVAVDAFGRALTAFADAGGTVLITVRSDALDRCTTLAGISELLSQCIQFVGPMTELGLRSAIEEPARLAGLRLEHGLTELILRDLDGRPAALPHMSHALVQTWHAGRARC